MKKVLDIFLSIPINVKKQKNSRFSKLEKKAKGIGFYLYKDFHYVIDDMNGSEWVCKNLNEVESILESEVK